MNRAKAGKPKTTFSSGPSFKARTGGKRPPTGTQKRAVPAISREKAAHGWDNSNATDSKFFDKNIDKDYLRKQRQAVSSQRPQSASNSKSVRFENSDLPQVEKDGSKLDIKFYTKGGRQTQNIQVYKDIDQLNKDHGLTEDAGRKTYSMAQNTALQEEQKLASLQRQTEGKQPPRGGHGAIEIAGVQLGADDVGKLSNILDGRHGQPVFEQGTSNIDQRQVLQQTIADAKMTALVGETL